MYQLAKIINNAYIVVYYGIWHGFLLHDVFRVSSTRSFWGSNVIAFLYLLTSIYELLWVSNIHFKPPFFGYFEYGLKNGLVFFFSLTELWWFLLDLLLGWISNSVFYQIVGRISVMLGTDTSIIPTIWRFMILF